MNIGSPSQAGFYYQNNLAALKLLELFDFNTSLLYVRLENYEVGNHIDDIILTRKDNIEFYQVKWSQDTDNSYTLYNLLVNQEKEGKDNNDEKDSKKAKTSKSLWKKLADGFRTMQTQGKVATIILYSTRVAGTAKLPSKNINQSLYDFIKFHEGWLASGKPSITNAEKYPEFKNVIDQLQTESGFEASEFNSFLRFLRFSLGSPSREEIRQQIDNKANRLGLESSQVDKLLDLTVQWSITGEKIGKKKLITALGINDRFVDRISHVFKIDETSYVENTSLFDQLDKCLGSIDSGFVFVEGVPGAGKSTALTKYAHQHLQIRFSYYCFIPGEIDINNRLQGSYFLKSLCVAIEKNFPELDLPQKYSDNYADKLPLYLDQLSTLNEKIIFLVDGLDHVDRREEFIQDPLTNHILSAMPGNLVMIMSAQYIEALPIDAKAQILAEPERHLRISRFSKAQVRDYVGLRSLHLQDEEIHLLHVKSEGIPLYLHYICTKLEEAAPNEYESLIQEFPALVDSKINTYHEQLFEDLRTNALARWVLGLLAIRKEYSSIEVVKLILNSAGLSYDVLQIGQVFNQCKHLLKEKDGKIFTIFHNSFREFIIGKTTDIKSALQDALIRYYELHPWEPDAYRNYFIHLLSLEKYDSIIQTVTDDWIKESWKRYNPIGEISDNINRAWQACVLCGSASEFVRIAFLKNQLHQATHNLSSSFTDANYFLDGGLFPESFRAVWDGEFSLVENEDFFNDYSVRYYHQTGNLIPFAIATQFFSTFLAKAVKNEAEDYNRKQNDFGTYLKAVSLYVTSDAMVEEIRGLNGYLTRRDLYALFTFLLQNKKLGHILALYEAVSDAEMKQYLLAWLILGLYRADSPDAEKYLTDFDITQLKRDKQIRFFEQLISIRPQHPLFNTFTFPPANPFLEEEVIDDRGDYQLKRGFRELLSSLKVLFYFSPDQYDVYRVRISGLPQYPARLYFGIAACANLWAKIKRGNEPAKKIPILKQIIDDLTIPAYVAQRIESGHGTRSFIKYRIQQVFSQVFECIVDCCNPTDIQQLVQYWIVKHNQSGYPDYNSDLVFARAILPLTGLNDEVYRIVQHAEDIARGDHGTTSLVESLSSIGAMYGKARRMEDYDRIYNELLSVACGVSYRKDYQFTNIFSALEKTHENNPNATLQRIADNYVLLYKIKDAGNARMFHICMAELIGFAINRYPELGFKLLIHEDRNLGRDEAIQIVLTDLLRTCPSEQLLFLWLVITTVGKWEHLSSSHDDYISNLYKLFFERMVNYADETLIESSYRHVWYQLSVERMQPHKISIINTILEQRSPIPGFLIYPAPAEVTAKPSASLPRQQKERPLTFRQDTRQPEMAELAGMDVDQIKSVMKSGTDALRNNRIRSNWHKCWKDMVAVSTSWFDSLPDDQKANVRSKSIQIRRKTIAALSELIKMNAFDARTFAEASRKLLQEIDKDFVSYELLPFLEAEDQLVEITRKALSGKHDLSNEKQVSVKGSQFLQLMQAVPMSALGEWVSLAEDYYDNPTLVQVYLLISKRIFAYEPDQSAIYLDRAFVLAYTLGYHREDWEDELITWAYTCTPQKANYYLLYSFYNWHIDREYDIPYKLHKKLLPWVDKFNEPGFYETYYQANYAFNKKLGEGLPEPEVDSEIISKHVERLSFPEIVLHYLADLCDYPVVKIRQLAIEALLWFHKTDSITFERFLINELKNKSANQQEHFIVVLYAMALKGCNLSVTVNQLGWMLQTEHFNIQQGFADILAYLGKKGEHVDATLATTAQDIHKKPFIPVQKLVTTIHQGRDFAFSDYQNILLNKLTDAEIRETRFDDELHTRLTNDGWDRNIAWKKEAAVHRHHNINSNYDRLEICGPWFAKLQEMINRQFYKHIRQGTYSNSDIQKIKYEFRLYDPGSVILKPEAIPQYIYWKGNNVTEEQFMAFEDVDELITDFINRDKDRITIFENGHHRIDEYPALFSQYFTASLFLAAPGISISELTTLLEGYYPYYHTHNFYRSEMEPYFTDIDPTVKMHGMIYPLVAVSDNLFRGSGDGAIAIALPALFDRFGHSAKYLDWQGPFKDDRRRFEPNSKGSTLTVDKIALKNYATNANLSIYLCLDLHRTNEKYKNESEMLWEECIVVRELTL